MSYARTICSNNAQLEEIAAKVEKYQCEIFQRKCRVPFAPWSLNCALYSKRNEIERLFRRLKGYRRIFSRFEKLLTVFLGFLAFVLIVEALSANTP